jgi:hypothetical protein
MKKLFESIFKSEPKLDYKPSVTAGGYADDLRTISAHLYHLFKWCDDQCGKNHPGFYHRFNGLSMERCRDIREVEDLTEILIRMIVGRVSNMIGGNVNMKAFTIDRIVDLQSTRNAVKNVIPSLSHQDLPSCNKEDDITMFFVGTYKETPDIISGVAVVSFKLRLEIRDYFASIDIVSARGYAYTDFRWIHDHLARIEKLQH